jgi:hypothetical protein
LTFWGQLTFLRKVRFAACAVSGVTALSVSPVSPAVVSAPVASGKKLFPHHPAGADDVECEHGRRGGGPGRTLGQSLEERQADRHGAGAAQEGPAVDGVAAYALLGQPEPLQPPRLVVDNRPGDLNRLAHR